MTKSTFKPYSISNKQAARKTYSITQFLGVNYNRDTLAIPDNNATEMKNLIFRDGVIQKRNGYEDLGSINNGKLNGVFKFIDELGNTHLLFHIGTKLYKINNVYKNSLFKDFTISEITGVALNDSKSFGFMDKHKMYIIDGGSYKVLTYSNNEWTIKDVYGSSDAYIPMTTIGITEDDLSIGNRTNLDDVNILTPFRKNKIEATSPIQGQTGSEFPYEFKLDDTINKDWADDDTSLLEDDIRIEIPEYELDENDLDSIFSSIVFSLRNSEETNEDIDSTYTYSDDSYVIALDEDEVDGTYGIEFSNGVLEITTPFFGNVIVDTDTEEDGYGDTYKKYPIISKKGSTQKQIGYVDYNNANQSSVFLNSDGIAILNAVKTMVVIYPHYNKEHKDIADSLSVGAIYNNQLFVSNNTNKDYHTEPINISHVSKEEASSISDFTYLSDTSYCAYGSDDTKIIGYDTYRDGDLIVFKEEKNNNATLYRRTKQLNTAIDSSGKKVNDAYEYFYPMYEINTFGGEGAINNNVIANFNGSTIYLTKNGLKVLSSKETTYNNARYSYDMSSKINYRYKGKYSKEDKIYTFKEKLFLITNNKVFMAFSSLANESELEWFPLDFGFVPEYMFEVDDDVYFVHDNELYRLNEEERYYQDRILHKYNVVQYDNENDEFYFSNVDSVVKMNQRAQLYFGDNSYVYRKIKFEDYITSNNHIEEKVYKYVSNDLEETEIELNQNETGFADNYYVRLDEKHRVFVSAVNDREVNETPYKGVELSDKYGVIKDDDLSNHENLKLIIIEENPVDSYYLTKPYNLGTSMYEKTIWGFTVINDSGLQSDTGISYVSSRNEKNIQTQVSSNGIDLSSYNYERFSFANDNLPHIFTKYKVIPRVSFIKFGFKNSEDTNMVLSELTLLYSTTRLTRGIK